MKVLAFDTSSSRLSVALLTTDEHGMPVFETSFHLNGGLRHAEHLVPSIEFVLKQGRLGVPDIELVVVAAGPGSFTGLRIGFATAKGLLAAGAGAYLAVPAADCYATALAHYPGAVVPVLDARKRRWYGAVYRSARRLSPYLDLPPEELLTSIEQYTSGDAADTSLSSATGAPPLISGPDAAAFVTQLESWSGDLALDPRHGEGVAPVLAAEGLRRYVAGARTPEDAGPDYLRRSEAEIGIQRRV